ncbi:hypothetical protein [Botrimarina colliarenosi]|nr:hypothetical protein [Botrimarina colliarenosi]
MKVRAVETLAFVVGLAATQAMGSGVGVSYYVPGTPVAAGPPAASCPPGGCGPVASCNSCQRLGFACVDHATVPPCTAEGGCYPSRGTWGWNQTRWRRWPGTEEGGPKPQEADAQDSLLPDYEEPAPEDEDKQAPSPIEDERSEEPTEGRDLPPAPRPGREIDLPAFPEPNLPRPAMPAPAPRQQQAPPAPQSLPFGYAPPEGNPTANRYGPPSLPFGSQPTSQPTSLPKTASSDDAPPPLPVGFTNSGSPTMLRRLPITGGRPATFDTSVQPASAHLPLTR